MVKNNKKKRFSKRLIKMKEEREKKDRINRIKNRIKKNYEIYHSEYPWNYSTTKEFKQMLDDMGLKKNTKDLEYNSRNLFNFKNKNYSKEYTPGRTLKLEKLYLIHKLN